MGWFQASRHNEWSSHQQANQSSGTKRWCSGEKEGRQLCGRVRWPRMDMVLDQSPRRISSRFLHLSTQLPPPCLFFHSSTHFGCRTFHFGLQRFYIIRRFFKHLFPAGLFPDWQNAAKTKCSRWKAAAPKTKKGRRKGIFKERIINNDWYLTETGWN